MGHLMEIDIIPCLTTVLTNETITTTTGQDLVMIGMVPEILEIIVIDTTIIDEIRAITIVTPITLTTEVANATETIMNKDTPWNPWWTSLEEIYRHPKNPKALNTAKWVLSVSNVS